MSETKKHKNSKANQNGKALKKNNNPTAPKLELLTNNEAIRMNDFLMILRSGVFFDAFKQRGKKPKYLENVMMKVESRNGMLYLVEVSRLENTITHQRLFESILELGKLQNGNQLVIESMYELKKLAGINTDTSDQEIHKLLKEITAITVSITRYLPNNNSEDGWHKEEVVVFHLFSNLFIDGERNPKQNKRRINSLIVEFDSQFLNATNKLNTVKIKKEILEYIHNNVENPYAEKIIKYCITQNKPFKEEIWKLFSKVADYGIVNEDRFISKRNSTLSKRTKQYIVQNIFNHKEQLNTFGINIERTTDNQTIISYNPDESQYKNAVMLCFNGDKTI